jgi:recombination protein RecT
MSNIVRYDPNSPMRTHGALKTILAAQQSQIDGVMPKHRNAERLIKLVIMAAEKNPKILTCTQGSIYQAVMTAAELGMDISGTLGEAYLIPYGTTCTFMLGYKGMTKLARQSGDIARIDSDVVYSNDHFVYQKGTSPVLNHTPCIDGSRGEMVGAWALVEYKNGGGIETEFLDAGELAKIRRANRMSGSGPWKDWHDEMAKKSAIKRVLKTATMSSDVWSRAVEIDNSAYDLSRVSEDTNSLNQRLNLEVEENEIEVVENVEDNDAS